MKTITQELLDGLKNADDIKAFLDLHEQDFLSQSLIDYLNELMNEKNITVAIMGCVVNGPGEAREADIGIAGGDGCGVLFKNGEIIKKVPESALLDELLAEIEKL